MPSRDLLSASVRRRLGALRTSLRGRLFCEGLAWLTLAAVAAVLLTLGLDYRLHLERNLRLVLTGVAAAGLLAILWRQMVRPIRVPMDIPAMALLIEKKFGSLGDRLISAVEFSARPPEHWEGVSPALIQLVGAQADAMAQSLDFRQVVERTRMRQLGLASLSAVMLLGGLAIWQNNVMGLWFERNVAFADVDWPQDTYVKVIGGQDFRVVRGDDLEVLVDAVGKVPEQVLLHAQYASGEKMEVRMESVTGAPRRFSRKFPTVAEAFSFYVTGGDDELDRRRPHEVTVVEAPTLRQVRFRVEHRAYMNRKTDDLDQSAGILPVTPGSTLRIEGIANKDLNKAPSACRLILDDKEQEAVDLRVADASTESGSRVPRAVRGEVYLPLTNVASSRTLKIVLTGEDGTVNRRGQQFIIQVQPDLAANVEIKKRAVGAVLTPQAYFPVILQIRDDYGLSEANIAVTCKNRPRWDVSVAPLPADANLHIEREVDLQGRGLNPGDVIQVFAEVRDNMPEDFLSPPTESHPNGVSGPNLSASGQMEFRIVKPEELKDAMVQRQKELRIEFAEAVVVQESSRAKALRALEDAQAGRADESAKVLLSDSSKLQASVGTETAKAAEVLWAVLEEMQFNRLAKPEDVSDIQEANMLLRDVGKEIQEVVSDLGDSARLTDAPQLAAKMEQTVRKQVEIKTKMDQILDHMLKGTTRQEMELEVLKLIGSSEDLLNKMKEEGRGSTQGLFQPPTTAPATGPAKGP
jgi:hypothetical protein